MANINDLAKITGFAKSTVSNVFTQKRYVSPEISDKVLKAAKEINYTPNYFASKIMDTSTNIIGLFLESNNENYYPFYNLLLQSLVTASYKCGKQVLVYFNPEGDNLPLLLKAGKSPLCGAVILSPHLLDKRIYELSECNIPHVIIGRPSTREKLPLSIDIDSSKLLRLVINHLYSRGHKRILFINSPHELTISQDRDLGVKSKLAEIEDLEVKTVYNKNECNVSIKDIKTAIKEGIKSFICASDFMANDVYEVAKELKMEIGKDLSVIALGGTTYAATLKPGLAICYQDFDRIGKECVALLENRLKDASYTQEMKIASGLYTGESVAEL